MCGDLGACTHQPRQLSLLCRRIAPQPLCNCKSTSSAVALRAVLPTRTAQWQDTHTYTRASTIIWNSSCRGDHSAQTPRCTKASRSPTQENPTPCDVDSPYFSYTQAEVHASHSHTPLPGVNNTARGGSEAGNRYWYNGTILISDRIAHMKINMSCILHSGTRLVHRRRRARASLGSTPALLGNNGKMPRSESDGTGYRYTHQNRSGGSDLVSCVCCTPGHSTRQIRHGCTACGS